MRTLIIIVAAVMLASCEDNLLNGENSGGVNSISSENITGNWSHMEYADTLTTLTKSEKLPKDEYGISFFADGTIKEWKNAGFCGTPPITYGEFEGTWELSNDSVLIINGTYWGGNVDMEWDIIAIHDGKMEYYVRKWDAKMD